MSGAWDDQGDMREATLRELTAEEVRERFLEHVWGDIRYWETVSTGGGLHGRLTGLAFSLLALLDGSAMDLPAFIVAPLPHEGDRAWHLAEGDEHWFPENHAVVGRIKADIGGGLHELFHEVGRRMGYEPPAATAEDTP